MMVAMKSTLILLLNCIIFVDILVTLAFSSRLMSLQCYNQWQKICLNSKLTLPMLHANGKHCSFVPPQTNIFDYEELVSSSY
jgi:hypothetical protein